MQKIVIIGNGIAGITAARHIRKNSDDSILVISGETDHFFSRTALMYIYMGHMTYEHTKPYEDWFWVKNKIDLKRGWVNGVDFGAKTLDVEGEQIEYDKLILATGSKSNKFGWPGENLEGVQGLLSKPDLDLMETNTKSINRAVIVGGGLIGVEMAEMLHSRNIPVTLLVRETNFMDFVFPSPEKEMIDGEIMDHGIDLRLATELDEIIDDGGGKVKGVKTSDGEIIDCEFVGLTVGVSPNIELFGDTTLETEKGILVNNYLETNEKDVYAIGDCAQLSTPEEGRRPIEAVWYVGRMMGETVARTVTGDRTAFKPGIWFNSAKFFDMEYQTYGLIYPECSSGEKDFYWIDSTRKKCLHFCFDSESLALKGVNAMGIRLRHPVVENWIQNKSSIHTCLERLKDAYFDPELYKTDEAAIAKKFNNENGTSISPTKKSWKRILEAIS